MENSTTQPAIRAIRANWPDGPDPALAIVLGSGWGPVVAGLLEGHQELPYTAIPGFPESTVEGHQGCLARGVLAGVPVWIMQGRFHYYEGYSLSEVTFPIRVFADLGVKGLLLTNAAGGIDPAFRPGQLMAIRDHINLMGDNPLRGPNNPDEGPRFPDMTAAWDETLTRILFKSAKEASIDLATGIYLAVSGPNFETPAEITAFRKLGANAVGMSTVPECIVARHRGMRVAGLSCITNVAAHEGGEPLTHEEVAVAARQSHEAIIRLFESAIPELHQDLTC